MVKFGRIEDQPRAEDAVIRYLNRKSAGTDVPGRASQVIINLANLLAFSCDPIPRRYYELGPDDPPYAAKFYDCCGAEDPETARCSTSKHVSYDDDLWCVADQSCTSCVNFEATK